MLVTIISALWWVLEVVVVVGVWFTVYFGLPIAFFAFCIAGYLSLTTGRCTSRRRMDGKTVIVTGANAGIGFETAKDLAMRGARVIMACRDLNRAEKARAEILKETHAPEENVVIKRLDLASLDSVRAFAKDILENEQRLDVLINNAGLVHPGPRKNTEDGLEYTMACNHYGHFLLTNLLLDLLKKSAPSRIVIVSALAHVIGNISPEHLLDPKAEGWKLYTDTKLANIVFAQELAKKLPSDVTVNSLHPGVVATEFSRNFGSTFQLIAPYVQRTLKTTAEGAQTTIHLAVSKEVEGVTGKYFSDCKVATVLNRQAYDPEIARKLWEISEKATGLSKKEE